MHSPINLKLESSTDTSATGTVEQKTQLIHILAALGIKANIFFFFFSFFSFYHCCIRFSIETQVADSSLQLPLQQT